MMKFLEEQQVASLTQEDKDTMQKYAEKQKELQEDTEEITETADKLSDQNPFMDESADRQLDLASKSMGEAKEKLDKNDAQGAVIDERESLYRLAEAKKGMEMAKERITKGMMGTGIPMPMQRPFHGRMDEGQFGASTEKVEIPSEEAYKVPKEFRQDILDALKEGLPEKYKDLNKDYYQRLVD
jgi:DNA repair exonuclease SbcCD ATPase subunit